MNRPLAAALLAASLALPGCAIHVADDHPHRAAETHCAVACPSHGEARAACQKPQVPSCTCEPTPAAVCTAAAGS